MKQAEKSLRSSLAQKHDFSSSLYLLQAIVFISPLSVTTRTPCIFHPHSRLARIQHEHLPPALNATQRGDCGLLARPTHPWAARVERGRGRDGMGRDITAVTSCL